MSAQINTIDELLAATRAAQAEHEQSEASRNMAARLAKRQELTSYINQSLSEVLHVLGLTLEDFEITDTKSGWVAHAIWDLEIDGQTYPLALEVFSGQAYICWQNGGTKMVGEYLAPGPQDPLDYLGQYLMKLPARWRDYQDRKADGALRNLTDRLDRAQDIGALLAIAAAADEEALLRPEDRAALRATIVTGIRNIRSAERAEREFRNARLLYAAEIIELAQAYVQEYAWYELACYDWATEWTRELWAPGELYKVRYVPVTADGNTEHCIQELVVVDHPSTMDMGDWNSVVTEVTSHGHVCKRWIGAFLDAKPIRWDKPLITDRYMYHTAIRAGDFYVNIPPADLVPVDTAAVEAARPEPPAFWVDWLRERHDGSGMEVPAVVAHYNDILVPMDAFEVARMTPAEFVGWAKKYYI